MKIFQCKYLEDSFSPPQYLSGIHSVVEGRKSFLARSHKKFSLQENKVHPSKGQTDQVKGFSLKKQFWNNMPSVMNR